WIKEGGGLVEMLAPEEEGGRPRLVNRTTRDLSEAWVVDGSRFYKVGKLPRGQSTELDLDTEGEWPGYWEDQRRGLLWMTGFEALEGRKGHIHLSSAGRPYLVAFAEPTLGSPKIDGFKGIDTSVTMVRIPVEGSERLERDDD
ncbi:MAG: hypothetical protein VX498_00265, partial [Myxococcota bacterium]|nr:hypothetical protein [Myxococcota bacterium]